MTDLFKDLSALKAKIDKMVTPLQRKVWTLEDRAAMTGGRVVLLVHSQEELRMLRDSEECVFPSRSLLSTIGMVVRISAGVKPGNVVFMIEGGESHG